MVHMTEEAQEMAQIVGLARDGTSTLFWWHDEAVD
jgi:hypothetical protein